MLVRLVIYSDHPLFLQTSLAFLCINSSSIIQMIHPGDAYCSIYNEVTNKTKNIVKKGTESVYVDYVAVDVKNKKNLHKVSEEHLWNL